MSDWLSRSIYIDVTRKIKLLRNTQQMTEGELGFALNPKRSQWFVMAIEYGEIKPDLDQLADIARALGVDLVDLLETRLLAGSTETELLARRIAADIGEHVGIVRGVESTNVAPTHTNRPKKGV